MATLDFTWNLRQIMAEQGIFQTTELQPLLMQHGLAMSREQVFRLVTQKPQRLSMEVLMALCASLGCQPNDLIETFQSVRRAVGEEPTRGSIGELRPPRAKIRRPTTGDPTSSPGK